MMLIYLLKSTLCLGIFWVIYKLLFENVKMHRFNRGYLLLSLVLSYVIPIIPLGYDFTHTASLQPSIAITHQLSHLDTAAIVQSDQTHYSWVYVVLCVYILVAALFIYRFGVNIYRHVKKGRVNPKEKYKTSTLVFLKEKVLPHTFLDYIFINKDDFDQSNIDAQLLAHEHAHATQKHTWDVILIETLISVFWFNPILRLYKGSMQLNHEFLADQTVIHQYQKVHNYQYLLLDTIKNNNQIYLASNINFQLTKKRLEMMTKQSSAREKNLLICSTIPMVLILLMALGRPVIAQSNAQVEDKSDQMEELNNPLNDKDKYLQNVMVQYENDNGDQVVQRYHELPAALRAQLPPPPPPPPIPPGGQSTYKLEPLPEGTFLQLTNNGSVYIGGNYVGGGNFVQGGTNVAPPPPPPPPAPVAMSYSVAKPQKPMKAHKSMKKQKPMKPHKAHKMIMPPVAPVPPVPPEPSLEDLISDENAMFKLAGKKIGRDQLLEIINQDSYTLKDLEISFKNRKSVIKMDVTHKN